MKISICGSMAFAKEMLSIKKELEEKDIQIAIPANTEKFAKKKAKIEDKWEKIKHDVIRAYFEEIKNSDAVLIVNFDKNEIKNYVGSNGLIEISFAHVLKKKIFLLNPIPKMNYTDEIKSMNLVILHGDLNKIKNR